MDLIHENTGRKIQIGDTVVDFRNEMVAVIVSFTKPRHPGSSGRVYVRPLEHKHDEDWTQEYFPSVFGLKFIEKAKDKDLKSLIKTAALVCDRVLVRDGHGNIVENYSAVDLTHEWLHMSNDDFFKKYGFSWIPPFALRNEAQGEATS